MIAEPGHRARFQPDALETRRIDVGIFEQRDGDVAVELVVTGEIDALLRSLAEELLHLIAIRGNRDGRRGSLFGALDARPAGVAELRRGRILVTARQTAHLTPLR